VRRYLLSEGLRAKCSEPGISPSTADNCRTAEATFCKYFGGKDADMQSLTPEIIKAFSKWMNFKRLNPNTRSCYMASLRAIYNRAVRHRRIKDRHPFKGVHTGHVPTEKRSISAATVLLISQLHLKPGSRLCLARDMFIFSVCAQGMSFADMADLRYSQVKENEIEYCRRKTGNRVCIELNPQMKIIMKRYRHENSNRLFPIITSDIPEVANRQYRSALNYHNRLLKEIAKRAGIKVNLTSYVSRHTWASLSYALGVPLAVISQGMGHSSTTVTGTYIRELNDETVAEANKKVLKEIFGRPVVKRSNNAHVLTKPNWGKSTT
jgi:integrase